MNYNLSSVEPIHVEDIDNARFYLYKAKDFFNNKWLSEEIKSAIEICRKEFLRYGPVPMFDKYDDNALVYLVRVEYPSLEDISLMVEEWLSIRFIPSTGREEELEDFYVTSIGGKKASDVIESYIENKVNGIWNHSLSISRLCGVSPFSKDSFVNKDLLPRRQQFTAISFALMVKECMKECDKQDKDYLFFVSRFRKDMIEKMMYYNKDGNNIPLSFKTVHETLGLPENLLVTFDRDVWSYKCPGYHLDLNQLLDLFEYLVEQGHMSHETIKYYTKFEGDFFKIREKNSSYVSLVRQLCSLGDLLTIKGDLHGSSLTGEELRRHVDEKVDDAPLLFLHPFDWWKEEVELFLKKTK